MLNHCKYLAEVLLSLQAEGVFCWLCKSIRCRFSLVYRWTQLGHSIKITRAKVLCYTCKRKEKEEEKENAILFFLPP